MLTIFSQSEHNGLEILTQASEIRRLLADPKQVTWIDIEKPTPAENELLDTVFNFHPLSIDDCLSLRHQPKVDNYGDYLFLIVHEVLPQSNEKEFKTTELDMYLGKNYLLTYHKPTLRSLDLLKDRAQKNPKPLFKSADFFMARVLDEVVNIYLPVLDQFDRKIVALEDSIMQKQNKDPLSDIFGLKKNLERLKRITIQQIEMLMQMINEGYDEIIPVSLPYLNNVRDHLERISERTDSNRDSISGLIEAHLLTSANKTNEVMKVLTIFAAIMLPLTVITGIYGMNFKTMPELEWEYGYLFALGLMVSVGGGLIYFFRRRGWF